VIIVDYRPSWLAVFYLVMILFLSFIVLVAASLWLLLIIIGVDLLFFMILFLQSIVLVAASPTSLTYCAWLLLLVLNFCIDNFVHGLTIWQWEVSLMKNSDQSEVRMCHQFGVCHVFDGYCHVCHESDIQVSVCVVSLRCVTCSLETLMCVMSLICKYVYVSSVWGVSRVRWKLLCVSWIWYVSKCMCHQFGMCHRFDGKQ